MILSRFVDKNSYTNIEIDQASKIGCVILLLAEYIIKNEIIKPSNKLPLSPKNNFGRLNTEKLKNKKIKSGTNIIIRNSLIVSSGIMKYRIGNTEIVVIVKDPSIPSK